MDSKTQERLLEGPQEFFSLTAKDLQMDIKIREQSKKAIARSKALLAQSNLIRHFWSIMTDKRAQCLLHLR
jgi:hypothetical protein